MKIYYSEDETYDSYKGVFSLDIDFLAIKNLFEVFIFFFLKFKKKKRMNIIALFGIFIWIISI